MTGHICIIFTMGTLDLYAALYNHYKCDLGWLLK